MYSKLASNAARALTPVLRPQVSRNVLVIQQRLESSLSTVENRSDMKEVDLATQVKFINRANDIYYGPERDYENFPREQQLAEGSRYRLGFIPESFFASFYEKTGVTGPYLLLGCAVTYLMSKEILVMSRDFGELCGFTLACMYLHRLGNKPLRDMANKEYKEVVENQWEKPLNEYLTQTDESIAIMKQDIEKLKGNDDIFNAYRESVDLQLEEEYRRRQLEVFKDVKKRLDYHVELEATERKFYQTQMVQWIVDGVKKGITPQQEKDSITKCFSDLKALAKTANTA